jgi:hypothetical protein
MAVSQSWRQATQVADSERVLACQFCLLCALCMPVLACCSRWSRRLLGHSGAGETARHVTSTAAMLPVQNAMVVCKMFSVICNLLVARLPKGPVGPSLFLFCRIPRVSSLGFGGKLCLCETVADGCLLRCTGCREWPPTCWRCPSVWFAR